MLFSMMVLSVGVRCCSRDLVNGYRHRGGLASLHPLYLFKTRFIELDISYDIGQRYLLAESSSY